MYTDAAGNVNVESNTFEWTYDTTSPTITLTAAEGSSGFISNDASISLTFTLSESTSDFTYEDVPVTGVETPGLLSTSSEFTSDFTSSYVTIIGGGTLSSFTGSGTTYTATYTPSTEGLQSIKVASGVYTDAAGNVNVESNTFEWTYDTTSPTITITAAEGSSGFISNDASISLTFTLSESTSDFTYEDVPVTGVETPGLLSTSSEFTSDFTSSYVTIIGGGTLSSFTGSGTTYTATYTPSTEGLQSIKVASGVYTDAAGNVNVESNTFEWTYDTTSPTITLTAAEGSSGFISNDASISLTFTLSESTSDFTYEDVPVTGVETPGLLSTSSEFTSDFTSSYVTIIGGGTLSSFTGSGTTYSATYTPSTEGLQSIKVASGVYTDAAGNVNVESNTFEWTYDTTSPTITITAAEGSSGFISNDASISLTFTLSESTSDFTYEDVPVTGVETPGLLSTSSEFTSDFTSSYVTIIGGGTLSSFTGSGTTYTATYTPSTEGLQSIKVASGVYTDAAGNVNVESNTFEWTYDTTSPTITITAAEGSSGFISNDASISLTFTLSESTSDFTYEDVPVTGVETPGLLSTSSEFTSDFTSSYVTIIGGGTLSSFTGSGTTYTATLHAFHRRASID